MNVVEMLVAGDREETFMDTTHKSVLLILLLASLAMPAVIAQAQGMINLAIAKRSRLVSYNNPSERIQQ